MLCITRKGEVLAGHRVAFHPSTYLHCIRRNGRPASEGDETEHRTEYFLKEQKHKLLKNAPLSCQEASLVAQTIRNLPAIQETWVGKIPWRREWQPTPVFLPGKCHGQRYSPGGHKELDMPEGLTLSLETTVRPLHVDFQVANFRRCEHTRTIMLVHVSGVRCHVCIFCTLQYYIEYSSCLLLLK